MRAEISDALSLADYLQQLSDDWLESHNFQTANDLNGASMTIRTLAHALDKHESKPDPIDMLAVWEYYCDHFDEGDKLPCEGALAKRQYVVDTMTSFCDHWWTYVHCFFGYSDAYDWEFLPVFLGRLSTHDVSKITPVEIEAALAAVIASDSFRLHTLKWKQGL